MKSSTSILITATLVFAALTTPGQLAAQHFDHYKFYDLGTFGGPASYVFMPNSYAPVLNNLGTVAGWADTSTRDQLLNTNPNLCFNADCYVSHAFEWQNGISDLGALAAGWSSLSTWINTNGLIAGISQNGAIDPTATGFFTGLPEARAVLWTNGNIQDLGTLGQGAESAALAVNRLGQVVGVSTNCSTAPNCKDEATALNSDFWGWNKPTRAFLWQNGAMQDLGTLGGSDAAALLINDQGQIVGESYINSRPSAYCAQLGAQLTTGAFLWQNNKRQNLGSFGGTCTFPSDLNNQGEVVGISTEKRDTIQDAFLWDGSLHKLPNGFGGTVASAIALNELGVAVGWASYPTGPSSPFQAHAALWTNSTSAMADLGTVDGDADSFAFSINGSNQVVGASFPVFCDTCLSRAFLWQNGSMVDLNTLIPASATLYLVAPETINDVGEIAGVGLDSNLNQHAFLLIPCDASDTACRDAAPGPAFRPAPSTTGPANNQTNAIRRLLRRQLGPLNKIADPSTSSAPSGSGSTNTTLPASNTPNILQDPILLETGVSTLNTCAPKGALCNPVTLRCCSGYSCVVICGSDCQHFGRCE